MANRRSRVPGYGLHKASGQAVVRLNGRDHYLGKHGSDESHARYERLIAEWLQNGRLDGSQTEEPRSIGYAMQPLCEQLRHAAATRIKKERGLEAARPPARALGRVDDRDLRRDG